MIKAEMNVGYLKDIIQNLSDDMEVYVGCKQQTNYDFSHGTMENDNDTFAIVHDGKLFITDKENLIGNNGDIIDI